MAHAQRDRYSTMVDAKLRESLVLKDGVVFNNDHEGSAKAGNVKVPVRDTEVAVNDYDKANGVGATSGTTTYIDLPINKDKAVNEVIDGYDAQSVPDNITADRLDSAGYSMALQIDSDGMAALEAGGTVLDDTATLTKNTVYEKFVDIRVALTKAKVPNDNKRFALISPDIEALVLKSPEFTAASSLGDDVKQSGAIGRIAGFLVIPCAYMSEDIDIVAGHPNWCSRVHEWAVDVHLQDLSGSGKYIGASAVQGRKVYGHGVTKKATLLIKKHA